MKNWAMSWAKLLMCGSQVWNCCAWIVMVPDGAALLAVAAVVAAGVVPGAVVAAGVFPVESSSSSPQAAATAAIAMIARMPKSILHRNLVIVLVPSSID